MPRSVSVSGLAGMLTCALAAPGCATPAATSHAVRAIHDYQMRERVERVEIGSSVAEAHAVLGRDPVHRPGHPEDPYPSPARAVSLRTAIGEIVSVEVYVVVARRAAEGACPDVQVEEMPVVFVDDNLGGLGWETVEGGWRSWGGSLEALRSLRDTSRCGDASAPVAAP